MRKYPKEWLDVVEYKLRCISDYSLMGSQRFINFKNPDDVLKILDDAKMLAPIPEPLEIEYCVVHKSLRGPSGVCAAANNYYSLGGVGKIENCMIVKMREVVE